MPDLSFDTNRRLKQDSEALVPAGDTTKSGFRLTWVGPDPFDFDWVQDSDAQILKGVGSPDGVVFAPKSTLYQERDEPGVWQNTDGLQAWQQLGSSGTARVSDFYNIGAPVGTNVASATLVDLEWPTLTAGPGILDLSTPTIPVTLYDGEHTVVATVVLGAGELTGGNPGEYIIALIRISDGTTPFFAETATTLMGLPAGTDEYRSLSVTAVVAAGSTVEIMAFNVNTGVTATVQVSEVVVTGPPS